MRIPRRLIRGTTLRGGGGASSSSSSSSSMACVGDGRRNNSRLPVGASAGAGVAHGTLVIALLAFLSGYLYAHSSSIGSGTLFVNDLLLVTKGAGYGHDYSSLGTRSTSSRTTTSTLTFSQPPTPNNNNINNTGWKSIDVFYGTSDHLQTEPNRTWFSQAHQDEAVAALLRHQRQGYFVDLAANDAADLSNSLALERPPYAWRGLCIEPNPVYWKNLSYRACQTVGAVVGARRDERVHFRFAAAEYGGIAGDGFANGRRWQRQSVLQSTVTLHEILQRHDAPAVIDYLSLDVEGAEGFILMAFPLHRYRIRVITAERPMGPIRGFLKNHSYHLVSRLTRWGETLWVHADYKHQMDWEAFAQLSQKYGFKNLTS